MTQLWRRIRLINQSNHPYTRRRHAHPSLPQQSSFTGHHPSTALQHYINTAMKKHISLLCRGEVAGWGWGVGESMSGPCLQCLFRAAKCTIWPLGHFRERLPWGPRDALLPRAGRYVSVRVSASLVRQHSLLRGAFVLMAGVKRCGQDER